MNMMHMIGKTPIHPLLFYSGKISGYIVWVLLLIALVSTHDISNMTTQRWVAVIILCIGLIFSIVSLINLGKSTRLGVPTEDTVLKTGGLYQISRNPMYLGFNLLSLSGIVFIDNIVVFIMGIYSMVVYHLIIVGEEKFLESRFSEQYLKYKKRVRRYL
ncbi:MAG TPA: isoprenylcysteine carboxylmethyltransferase family protein [Syntrophales bacterium]|nr:isoprenylcysteine carboxylmethyltransferase family protein [Syntrophales bacterium]